MPWRTLPDGCYGICKTRIALTRFSVPLIPSTRILLATPVLGIARGLLAKGGSGDRWAEHFRPDQEWRSYFPGEEYRKTFEIIDHRRGARADVKLPVRLGRFAF